MNDGGGWEFVQTMGLFYWAVGQGCDSVETLHDDAS